MRRVGEVTDETKANRFATFLGGQGIGSEVRDDGGGTFAVWVLDEDRLEDADRHWQRYKAEPDAAEFVVKGPTLAVASKDHTRLRRPFVQRQSLKFASWSTGPATISMICISVVATVIARLPGGLESADWLYFSDAMGSDFPEIAAGQVWRLVTPIFLHGGALHLFFNMLWMHQLAGDIERREGTLYVTALVALIGIACNIAQYLVSGPNFVGMSGVVYGTLGYAWMMAKFDARYGYDLAQNTVVIMVAWLVICLVGLIPGVANTQHVVGLGLGCGWGFLRSRYWRAVARRRRWRG